MGGAADHSERGSNTEDVMQAQLKLRSRCEGSVDAREKAVLCCCQWWLPGACSWHGGVSVLSDTATPGVLRYAVEHVAAFVRSRGTRATVRANSHVRTPLHISVARLSRTVFQTG